ncbi:MAG: type II toxin-antitoxin system RelE/ParE family toxin [Planctomycetales bacterium]
MAEVVLSPEAGEEFERLPKPIQDRALRIFERLEDWPEVSGAKPLSGDLAGHWRMRTGDYRVQFRVKGETVIIERLGHRDRFYE